jgi:DNA-binding HxlR family transcriptional regulator
VNPLKLTDRDYLILKELDRWRFILSRQIRLLCGFPSQRTCDRRLKILLDNDFIARKYILYGVAGLYTITRKGKTLIGSTAKNDKIKTEQISHDIAVVDTAIYFLLQKKITPETITTEKQLHQKDGFGTRKHHPDFIFSHQEKTYCVEVELTPKSKDRTEKNLDDNFRIYDKQKWIVPNNQTKIHTILNDNSSAYPNVEIISLECVEEFVKSA